MADAVINYSKRIIAGGEDLTVTTVSNGVDARYGDWTNGGSGMKKRSEVTFNIRYSNITQSLQPDNSIKVEFDVVVSTFTRTFVSAGFNATTRVEAVLDYVKYWDFQEQIEQSSSHAGFSRHFSFFVAPLTTSWAGALWFKNKFTTIQGTPGDEFDIGVSVYNPNPPDYRPGKQLHSGVWQSHNRSGGKADVRVNGAWVTMRTQDGPTGTGNPPLIRRSDEWKNQSKIGENS